ncbi:hypothetical protein [Planctomyces sp. SH-PL62]|uniref:hypothetical protein n=1 Tax=Planctomyces sp. SH-PL62 TaxID=1636152 RepID=UPI00078D4AD7|nr:hypothetical protein [Planctomyces sp. SH-PL62]AMV38030.1 hypothetical protein VT85_11375 [Planctomyces sp. SH-PL62]
MATAEGAAEMLKSLDRKLAAIHANPNCREFILADAKDADMALGLGAPGQSPELHAGEVRFKTLEQYREQMRLITRQGLVDIMLMSASSNYALTFGERLFDDSAVTPAIRANDTTDIHLARESSYAAQPARPFRTASLDHAMCGHLDCKPEERTRGADLGLYSVTFNNDLRLDLETLERFHAFREEAERKGFRYFLEVFDPNVETGLSPEILPFYLNDMITRMLAGVAPAGRPVFLKIVYHGPKAMEELVRFDPHLVVGILGGSSGTTRDAFQLLHDAQKHGAKVALFGRKINNAENQLAFVQFLRLIVDGVIHPVDAVKAYHAVLGKLGVAPHRSLEDDLQITEQSMSYAGGKSVTVPPSSKPAAPAPAASPAPSLFAAQPSANGNGAHGSNGNGAHAAPRPLVTESRSTRAYENGAPATLGSPDFGRMNPADRLAYHRSRLGLGR